MSTYIFISALCIIPLLYEMLAKSVGKTVKTAALFTMCFILCFFMAFRDYSVGIDTREYIRAFEQIKNFNLYDAITQEVYGLGNYTLQLETGYRVFNWFSGLIIKNNQILLVTESILVFSLLYYVIKRDSKNPLLSAWLYLTLGIFQTEMNISRNAIAMLIFYCSLKYILSKEPVKYYLAIMIAISFHYSSVIFLPLYFVINNVDLNWKTIRRVLLCAAVIAVLLPVIRVILALFIPQRYQKYLFGTVNDFSSIIVGAFYLALLLFVSASMGKRCFTVILDDKIGAWLFLLNIVFFILAFSLHNSARIAALFGPYIIVFLPNLIYKGINKGKQLQICSMVFFICLVQYILRLSINNIGGTIPYSFCF